MIGGTPGRANGRPDVGGRRILSWQSQVRGAGTLKRPLKPWLSQKGNVGALAAGATVLFVYLITKLFF